MKRLSPKMRQAYISLRAHWQNAPALGGSIATMDALVARGLAERWTITEIGPSFLSKFYRLNRTGHEESTSR